MENQFEIEKVFTAEDIRLCKEFMKNHIARDNLILIRHLCDVGLNLMNVPLFPLDKYQNAYCSLYNALIEFFSVYLTVL